MPKSDGLFLQACAGDLDALQAFFELHGRPILMAVRGEMDLDLRAEYDSTDFMQEARIKLLLANVADKDFESPQKLSAYMIRIAVNEVRQARRERARGHAGKDKPLDKLSADEQQQLADSDPGPSQKAAAREEFLSLLAELEPGQRQIIVMKVQCFSHEEIEERLGVSKSTIYRALKALGELVKKRLKDGD